jgi:hypothetical protein
MGAVSLQEDSVDRFIESNPEIQTSGQHETSAYVPRPSLKYCPLCIQGYLDEFSLDNHIASEHGKQHFYLRVNDQIVRDICWLIHPLEECELVLLGIPKLDIELELNGKTTRLSIKASASLMTHLPGPAIEGVLCIKSQCDHLTRSFQIYLGRQPTFRSEEMDATFLLLMGRMKTETNVDLIAFCDQWARKPLNDLQYRYLKGVLEYCHGWRLELEGSLGLARPRLEAAMSLLMPFKTIVADDIRCALALRMNCFSGQWACDETSPFRLAEAFFCSDNSADSVPHAEKRETQILVDRFSEQLLEAINAYSENNARRVFAILNDLRAASLRDRNDEDKLAILEARTKRNMGDKRGAMAAYEPLLEHPRFGNEAHNACRR